MGPEQLMVDLVAQIAFVCINLVGLSIIALAIGHKISNDDLTTISGWQSLTWAKYVILGIFVDSWFYLFASGLLVNGIGLELNYTACASAITLCVAFYSTSKMLVYIFLSERVYVVWNAGEATPRRKSNIFRICMLLLLVYAAIMATMFVGKIVDVGRDRQCHIGLHEYVSITVLAFDLFVNVFLTSLFVIPIWRANFTNTKLKVVSRRTLIASSIALTTSSINMAILTAYHGYEAGWVCLSTCSLDVAINALVILWATSGISEEADSHPITLPHIPTSLTIPSIYRDGYTIAPGNTLPKTIRRRICPKCYVYYSMDEPCFMAELYKWNHAATLPLELEAGPRDVRIGRAPPDIDDYSIPDTMPVSDYTTTTYPSDNLSDEDKVSVL